MFAFLNYPAIYQNIVDKYLNVYHILSICGWARTNIVMNGNSGYGIHANWKATTMVRRHWNLYTLVWNNVSYWIVFTFAKSKNTKYGPVSTFHVAGCKASTIINCRVIFSANDNTLCCIDDHDLNVVNGERMNENPNTCTIYILSHNNSTSVVIGFGSVDGEEGNPNYHVNTSNFIIETKMCILMNQTTTFNLQGLYFAHKRKIKFK